MEFLVRIDIHWPPEAPSEDRERIWEEEFRQGQLLAEQGLLRRLWRVPGRSANWSLYEAQDATQLHEALCSLPLYPWMDIEVHPLAVHLNDPVARGVPQGAESAQGVR